MVVSETGNEFLVLRRGTTATLYSLQYDSHFPKCIILKPHFDLHINDMKAVGKALVEAADELGRSI